MYRIKKGIQISLGIILLIALLNCFNFFVDRFIECIVLHEIENRIQSLKKLQTKLKPNNSIVTTNVTLVEYY